MARSTGAESSSVNIFGTGKAFGFAALVRRVEKRATRRGVVWRQGRKASRHPGETHSPSQKAHTAGNLVKMRGSSDEETDAGRPCCGRDVDGGLGQARDKGPKDAAVMPDIRNMESIPGLGRCPGEGHGNPLQCPCLKNPIDRGTWETTVHWVTKRHNLSDLARTHTHFERFLILSIMHV